MSISGPESSRCQPSDLSQYHDRTTSACVPVEKLWPSLTKSLADAFLSLSHFPPQNTNLQRFILWLALIKRRLCKKSLSKIVRSRIPHASCKPAAGHNTRTLARPPQSKCESIGPGEISPTNLHGHSSSQPNKLPATNILFTDAIIE